MNQEEVLNFISTLDYQWLAGAAVLLFLLLLLWRILSRTSRIEREVVRLNERLERIREETRSGSRSGPPSVAPIIEAPSSVEEVAPETEPAAEDTEKEEEDVLSRAVASLEEERRLQEPTDDLEDNSFSFDAEPHELFSPVEEEPAPAEDNTFIFGEPAEPLSAFDEVTSSNELFADEPVADEPIADEPIADEPIADEPVADEPVALTEDPSSGVVRLEGDPARPGVSMVRCLSCNYKLAYPEKLAGKRVRCPSCRASLQLP